MAIPQAVSDNPTIMLRFAKRSELLSTFDKPKENMKSQKFVTITNSLLRATLVQSGLWVSDIWRDEAVSLFDNFDTDGETAIEVAVSDSDIPANELENIMRACTAYGLSAVREAILRGLDLRSMETAERDDIGEYKATLKF